MPGNGEAHYRGSYGTRAKRLRDAAYADASTRCWRCGLTLAEAQAQRSKPVTWDAGHLVDGEPDSPLAPEHSHCNRAAGRRLASRVPQSRRWY